MIAPRPCAAHGVGVGCGPGCAEAATYGRGTALHSAAYYGHADATCALLIAGATEGIKDKRGYASRCWAGACEPRGNTLADAACRRTAEDVANARGYAAAYADAVKRVRLLAHAGATVCACVGCKCGMFCACSVCALCVCACVRVCVCVCVCVRVCV